LISRFRFISAVRAVYGVQRLCRVLDVHRSAFYRWLAGEPARQARAVEDERIVAKIREFHKASKGTYGSPRITGVSTPRGEAHHHQRIRSRAVPRKSRAVQLSAEA
jgi:hypothetical protein